MIQLWRHFTLQGKENRQNIRAYYTVDPINTLVSQFKKTQAIKNKRLLVT